ncbi:MAG: hypothetical protein WBF35_15365 [Candidatus Acidiferrales bacterium]
MPPPAGVAQFALPLAAIPIANCEPEHCEGVAASAVAVAALPLVLDVSDDGIIAAVSEPNDGAAELPVKFPNTVLAETDDNENEIAGVVEALATEQPNSGDSALQLTLETLPPPLPPLAKGVQMLGAEQYFGIALVRLNSTLPSTHVAGSV